jgi:hypothetical protein
MRRFGKLLVVLLLAYAWTWTGLLRDLGVIDNGWRLWILIATTVLFLLQQTFAIFGSPADASAVEAKRDVISAYLNHLINDYYALIEERLGRPRCHLCVLI